MLILLNVEENIESSQQGGIRKSSQELPINMYNFPFKYTQDFNQTTHVVLLSLLIISVYILITAIMFQNWWEESQSVM